MYLAAFTPGSIPPSFHLDPPSIRYIQIQPHLASTF